MVFTDWNLYNTILNVTLSVKDDDDTKTENINIIVLQVWHISH